MVAVRTTVQRQLDSRPRLTSTPKPRRGSSSWDVVPVVCNDGVTRIRLATEVLHKGTVSLGTDGSALLDRCTFWLDGTITTEHWIGKQVTEEVENVGARVVAGQTRSIADFGRLELACATLVQLVDELPEDASEAQVESLLASYQGVLAWMNEARARMTAAEGQVDVVQAKLLARLMS